MNSDSMRSMIDQVLQECYDRGLYIPIVSFDGQWSNIAIRDRKGNALTLLQLQKDVQRERSEGSGYEFSYTDRGHNLHYQYRG